jgi:hypothetical protein
MTTTVSRAFTPSQGAPPGSAANPLPLPPGSQTTPSGQIVLPSSATSQGQVAKPQAMPTPPTPPAAPPAPPQFQPGQSPGAKQRAAVTATTMLGAAAAAGQTARKSLLGQ